MFNSSAPASPITTRSHVTRTFKMVSLVPSVLKTASLSMQLFQNMNYGFRKELTLCRLDWRGLLTLQVQRGER